MSAIAVPPKLKAFVNTLWNADDRTLRWVLGGLIVVLACFNFLRDLNNPPHAFWDESYYVTAAERYQEHRAQYASHPPLAFMLMTVGIEATGANRHLDTTALGQVKKIDPTHAVPDGYDFTGIRLPAALFAVFGALLFYLIMLRLAGEAFEAFVFSLLFVFENAYIVHFRAAHLDSYQLTFALGAILVWLGTYGRAPKRPLVAYGLFGLLCGLSFMCKVNSLVLLTLGGLSLLRAVWLDHTPANWKRVVVRGLATGGAFAVAVAAIFTLHTVLNPVAPDPDTDSGRRDLHYMSQTYQDWLNHKAPLTPAVLWDASSGYYQYMKHDFTGEIKTEANGSQPILWPFMSKAINYRWDFDGKRTAYTQMVGNPVNWGFGLAGLIGAVVLIVRRRTFRAGDQDSEDLDRLEALFAMFMIFWMFHIWLGTQRVMYIYHYFIGLALSFMLVPLVFKLVARRIAVIDKNRFVILCGISLLIALSYLWFAPLTYHQYIPRAQCDALNWPVTRVICQPVHKKPKPAEAL